MRQIWGNNAELRGIAFSFSNTNLTLSLKYRSNMSVYSRLYGRSMGDKYIRIGRLVLTWWRPQK